MNLLIFIANLNVICSLISDKNILTNGFYMNICIIFIFNEKVILVYIRFYIIYNDANV